MQIELASPRGFCAGVDRAIEVVEQCLGHFGAPVYVRHEIVHNRHVVEDLRKKGAIFVENPEEAPEEAVLVFSAHGVAPDIRERAAARRQQIIDATCPLVTKVHKEAQRFVRENHEIILVGHADHVEVMGTMGHGAGKMHLVESVADVAKLDVSDPDHLGCLTQTTLSVDDTREILDALKARFPAIALPRKDDICYATQNRQNAVKKLVDHVDLLLVVGAPESSNSNRLAELGSKSGVPSYLVQDASEIDARWLRGTARVGVTAGASAPENLVEDVIRHLEVEAGPGTEITAMPKVDEGVTFQLPPELRRALTR